MIKIWTPICLILFLPCSNYYYLRSKSTIYIIDVESNIVSNDFVSLFPFYLSLTDTISSNYFIIGKTSKRYDESLFTKDFSFLEGDIALLEDYTYVIFKNPTLFENNSAYIGNINNFDEIVEDVSTNADRNDRKILFENEESCNPYILAINGEIDNIVKLDKIDKLIGEYCQSWSYYKCVKKGNDYYYYGIINFSTRGTKKLNEVPPIYLNNTYLSDDCEIEQDGFSIKCKIREEKWNNNCSYKVNELYEGCFGPIFTSIIIHLPYVQHYKLYNSSEENMNSPPENQNSSAENMNIRLFILFYFIINLFIII